MTTSIARPASLLRLDRAALGSSRRCVGVALCTLALLAAAPVGAQAQGSLITWGDQLLDDPGTVSETPTGTFIAVAAGNFHSHAIRTNGTLVSWGSDLFEIAPGPELLFTGQISDTPAGTFTAVSAGDRHSVAIRTNGTLVSWGLEEFGEVSDTPAGTFSAVSAGLRHTTAIRTDGTLVEWGEEVQSEFALRPTTGTYLGVAAGREYSVALRTDGTLVTWGNHLLDVVLDTPAGTFIAVSAGPDYAVAIRTNGTLVAWGRDSHGLVSDTPAGTFEAVSAGADNAVAIRTDPLQIDGRLVSWGFAGSVVSDTPPFSFTAVAAGGIHAVGIRRPLTVLEQIDVVSLSVLELVDSGAPLPANGQSLQVKLDAAADALEVDDTDAAIGSLGAFINQTEAFVRTNKLTDAQGEDLIVLAEDVIINLGG